jgi:hypothetical protein
MKKNMTMHVVSANFWRVSALLITMIFFVVGCENGLLTPTQGSTSTTTISPTSTSTVGLTFDDVMNGASLPHVNLTNLNFPVKVAFQVDFVDCSNNPGPFIYFSGFASTGGFGVRTIFRNNVKGTHEFDSEKDIDVSLQPAGTPIIIPKQPSRGGVGGNPYIYVQFEDAHGNPIGDEIFIGRCVQGSSFKGSQQVACTSNTFVNYQVSGCDNNPGPTITFDAGFSLSGINARIIFRNNEKGTHEAIVESSTIAQVVQDGTAFSFPKQPVLGGVGGNPWIWTQFTDGNSVALSDEILIGRCVQLSQSLTP